MKRIIIFILFFVSININAELRNMVTATAGSWTLYVKSGIHNVDTLPTIQSALDSLPCVIVNACTIKVLAGTYSDTGYSGYIGSSSVKSVFMDNKGFMCQGSLLIIGDTITPSNVLIRSTIDYGGVISNSHTVVKGMHFRKFSSSGLYFETCSDTNLSYITADSTERLTYKVCYIDECDSSEQAQHSNKAHFNDWDSLIDVTKGRASGYVSIMFDDGHSNDTIVWRIAKEIGVPVTFSMITDSINNGRFLDSVSINSMYDDGAGFASHSKTHAGFSGLFLYQTEIELRESKRRLETVIQNPDYECISFVYPAGVIYSNGQMDATGRVYYCARSIDTYTTGITDSVKYWNPLMCYGVNDLTWERDTSGVVDSSVTCAAIDSALREIRDSKLFATFYMHSYSDDTVKIRLLFQRIKAFQDSVIVGKFEDINMFLSRNHTPSINATYNKIEIGKNTVVNGTITAPTFIGNITGTSDSAKASGRSWLLGGHAWAGVCSVKVLNSYISDSTVDAGKLGLRTPTQFLFSDANDTTTGDLTMSDTYLTGNDLNFGNGFNINNNIGATYLQFYRPGTSGDVWYFFAPESSYTKSSRKVANVRVYGQTPQACSQANARYFFMTFNVDSGSGSPAASNAGRSNIISGDYSPNLKFTIGGTTNPDSLVVSKLSTNGFAGWGFHKTPGAGMKVDIGGKLNVDSAVTALSYAGDGTGLTGTATSLTSGGVITALDWFDDFLGGTNVSGNVGDKNWAFEVSGANTYILSQSAEIGTPGQYTLSPGTATNGRITLFPSVGSPTYSNIRIAGNDRLDMNMYIGALSTAGDEYVLRYGFGDVTNADFADGEYFEYSRVVSANWQYCTSNGSVRTKTASTTAVATSFTKLSIRNSVLKDTVEFYVNNVSVGKITTNIPAGYTTLMLQILKTAGTTQLWFAVDYVRYYNLNAR